MSLDTNPKLQSAAAAQTSRSQERGSSGRTTATTFALPLPADKVAGVRSFVAEILGPRRAEFEESWRAKRIIRETAWLQPAPEGAMVLVTFEAEDLERAFGELAASETAFDCWYRDRVLDLYGVDLRRGGAFNELLADWRAP